MPFHLSRSELLAYTACCVLVVLIGWRVLRSDAPAAAAGAPAPTGQTSTSENTGGEASGASVSSAPPRDESATVDVVGAVARPGVYRLDGGQRVQDAIRRAGGATRSADLEAINLAAKLADGQQVVVPRRSSAVGSGADVAAAPAAGAAAASGSASASASGPPAAPVNLNSATADQLDTLDGVGPATAQKILEYRTQHGGFSSVDELGQIAGIGPKRLEALRARVTV